VYHPYQHQFGCGILKMVVAKMQDFCPRINMLKSAEIVLSKSIFYVMKIALKQACDELWFIKKCRNHTFKVNFLCQNHAQFLMNWCSPYSQNTMVSFEYVDFWPKILEF